MSIAEMSSDDNSDKECPLCMEAFDLDDFNFFPCNCQYQICRFCWHRISVLFDIEIELFSDDLLNITNENGLCPACRQSYPEDPVNFQPLSSAEVHKIKTEKKQKVLQQKNKIIEDRKHLSEYRVLQKNLVYAVGISQRMANPELLKKPEFFGKFGKILKVAVGTAQAINNSTPPTHTAYVTFARCEDALRAIQAVNNMVVEGRLLKASLGTTKYCSSFLKGQTCYKPECMYLHEVADEKISFTKEDMHQGKHTEYERRLLEHMFALFGIQGSTGFNQQQQTSTCRELVVARNRARVMTSGGEQMEKKRPTSGSVENLPKLISQQIKQKKGNDDTVLTQKQQQKPLTINGDVLNNNNFEKSNSQQQMLQNNKMSSSSTSTTPSPPTFVSVSQNVLIQQQQQQPPNSSAIINSFVDDDDLGFDPFEESAKALKEIMQEEKQNFVIPQPSQQQIYMNGGDKYTINGTSSSSHTTENNPIITSNNHHHPSLYTTSTTAQHQQQQHRHQLQQQLQHHSSVPMMTSMPGLHQQNHQNYHQNNNGNFHHSNFHPQQQHQQQGGGYLQQQHQNFNFQQNNFQNHSNFGGGGGSLNYGSSSTILTTTTNDGRGGGGGRQQQQNHPNNNHNTWLPVPPGFSPRSSTGSSGF
uniref:CCR4-NOT transcription complex subunit 4 n=1 Tax=Meloidogyne incognita TaxID=6306 RepID=A0A914LDQ0_MELIC